MNVKVTDQKAPKRLFKSLKSNAKCSISDPRRLPACLPGCLPRFRSCHAAGYVQTESSLQGSVHSQQVETCSLVCGLGELKERATVASSAVHHSLVSLQQHLVAYAGVPDSDEIQERRQSLKLLRLVMQMKLPWEHPTVGN